MRLDSEAKTTTGVRKQNFTLIVAPSHDGKAKGWLYMDDGESADVGDRKSEIEFTWDGKRFEMAGTFVYDAGDVVIVTVVVLGGWDSNATYKARTIVGGWKLDRAFCFSNVRGQLDRVWGKH